jgi:hypothetical protein
LPPPEDLWNLVNGYRVSQAIYVAATLGLANALADGPRTSAELAGETDADPDALYRLLRALASVGVFYEDDARRFSLTPLGEGLRSDRAGSIRGWAAFIGRPYYWQAWGNLLHSVQTGENAFRHVHGVDVWDYRTKHPEESPIFDRAMTDLTKRVTARVLEEYDFGRFGTIVDVGGGQGALLTALLEANPGVNGVLFDQPHVVANASVPENCRVVGGSFFESVPEGGDVYLLKWIVHDWDDEEAIAILRACRRAMSADAVVLLIERVVGEPNEDPATKFSDLNMLVSPGGRERTVDEYAALFDAAGLRLNTVSGGNPVSVIEALPHG